MRIPTTVLAPALLLLLPAFFSASVFAQAEEAASRPAVPQSPPDLRVGDELKHFGPLKQLTFGGENAEAYFSHDDRSLIFQSTRPPYSCDQIFTMGIDGSAIRCVSTGKGKTTCAYYFPDGERILFSSTHESDTGCPPKPDYSKGYVWRVEQSFDIYSAKRDGTDPRPLVKNLGYDAEATISRDGKKIVFTSDRDGDLELYRMDADGSNVVRLTNSPGYDGGAFFSFDGSRIVFRAREVKDARELEDYQVLLKQGMVRPGKLEIFTMDADGKDRKQVTNLDAGSFAPFMHPDNKRIVFSSNHGDPKGREFELFLVNIDGSGLERVTHSPQFDGFPMWTSDGKKLVFASNRGGATRGDTNIFITDWKE